MMLDYFNQALRSPAFQEPYINRLTLRKKVTDAMVIMLETTHRQEIENELMRTVSLCLRALAEFSKEKCIVLGCENHRNEGEFVGDICAPCYAFIARGEPQGRVWNNALATITQLGQRLKKED